MQWQVKQRQNQDCGYPGFENSRCYLLIRNNRKKPSRKLNWGQTTFFAFHFNCKNVVCPQLSRIGKGLNQREQAKQYLATKPNQSGQSGVAFQIVDKLITKHRD